LLSLCLPLQFCDWAIEEKFSTGFDKLVADLCVVKCAAEDSCPFFIRCALNEKGFFAVTKLHAEHPRVGAARVTRSVENTQWWLLRKVPEVIAIDGKIMPKQIVDNLRLKFEVDVNEKAARRAKATLLKKATTSQRVEYHRLPAYIDELRAANPAHLKLNLDPDTGAFRSLFICPQTAGKRSDTAARLLQWMEHLQRMSRPRTSEILCRHAEVWVRLGAVGASDDRAPGKVDRSGLVGFGRRG
jgi:hypothetical protein